MEKLIQEIIDGVHVITEQDFIDYPRLGYNRDIMEIAIDENPNFIKYANIRMTHRDKRDGVIDLYEYAIKKGYVPTVDDFKFNRNLAEKEAIEKKCRQDLTKLIENIENNRYVLTKEEFVEYSNIFKYILKDLKWKFYNIVIEKNPSFVKYLEMNLANSDTGFIELGETLVTKAISLGYIPTEEDFKENYRLGDSSIMMKKAIEVNFNLIKYSRLNTNDNRRASKNNKEIYKQAIQFGYIPTEEDLSNNYFLCTSFDIMKKAIEINNKLFRYTKNHTDDLVNYAIQSGYILTPEDIEYNPSLLKSSILMKQAIDIEPKYVLKSDDFDKFDSNLIIYAISKGYVPTEEEIKSKYSWTTNNEIMKNFIKINPKFVELAKNYDELFYYAITNGYSPTFNDIKDKKNLLNSNELYIYLLKNDPQLYNNKFLQEYIKRDSVKGLNLSIIKDIWNFIYSNEVYESMEYNDMLFIIKYIYCKDDKQHYFHNNEIEKIKNNLNQIIDSKKIKEFNQIIKIIDNNINPKQRLLLINNISENFIKYYDLCCIFLKTNIDQKDIYLLRKLLLSEEKIDIQFKTLDDLQEYDKILYEQRKQEILSAEPEYDYATCEYYPEVYYDKILLMLLNMDYKTYLNEVNNGFSSKDITILQNNIKDIKCKEELSDYKTIIQFIESLLKVKDAKKLKKFALRLNNSIYKNSEATINIYETLRNIHNIKNYYYGQEIKEKLLDINTLSETEEKTSLNDEEPVYIRENAKYECPNIEIFGENIRNRKIDYIELNGIDFTLFVHVLNAYGEGGTLEDFKRNRLIGKTYICLSPITDQYYWGLADENKEIEEYDEEYDSPEEIQEIQIKNANYVKLVFSNLYPEQLIAMGNEDIYSDGEDNSLIVSTSVKQTYAPIRDNVKSLDYQSYCEYDFYRNNNNGDAIYPSAILCDEEEPSMSEKIAAAYLQIPILHINDIYLEKTSNLSNENKTELNINKKNETLKKQLLEIRDILVKGIDKSDATIIESKRNK